MKSATFYSKPKSSASTLPAMLDNGAVREKIRIRHCFSDATKGHNLKGFSRPGLPTAAKA
jgi:hypothetical protein